MGNESKNLQKIIIIIGQTSSGKSDLAVYLGQMIDGEVISADSRQVYKGMNIGTGKIKKEEMNNVPHHLLDVVSPNKIFSIANYIPLAEKKIVEINKRGNIPIICGGTAFYIDSLINKNTIPEAPPDWDLRKSLENRSCEYLFNELQKIDPKRASTIDKKNKRRIIRAIEIIRLTKKAVPPLLSKKAYNSLYIGIAIEQEKLNKKIEERLLSRIEEGMIQEVKKIHTKGVSWKRLESFGLEYKWSSLYLQKKISYDEMVDSLLTDIKKFSKRQKTWWKRNKQIHWIKNKKGAYILAKKFIKN